MILLLDTSTPVCMATFVAGDVRREVSWEANRELAKGLLGFLETELNKMQEDFSSITGIGAYLGPGSFTGLRIGLTVLNTLADGMGVPIVGETGEGWQDKVLTRLKNGENQRIVVPLYGGEANITKARK